MPLRYLIYDLVSPILGAAARNRRLISLLFGVRIPRQVEVHFDPTTLILWRALRHITTSRDNSALEDTSALEDNSALEIGIGQGALLSIALAKTTPLTVQGIDCSAARVESSRQVAAYNHVQPEFFCSNLFADVPAGKQFDLIFFNPPYVPTDQGRRLHLTRRMHADSDHVWDGGADGTEVLRNYLQQGHQYLTPRGRLLFGVQPTFLPAEAIAPLLRETGWEQVQSFTSCCIPSVAYILSAAGSHPAAR